LERIAKLTAEVEREQENFSIHAVKCSLPSFIAETALDEKAGAPDFEAVNWI
jgi:hypothetical protein